MKIVNDLDGHHLAYWADQFEAAPVTFAPPPGMPDCEACAAIVTDDEGQRVVRVAWKPNEIDLAHLARGGTLWLSTWGGLPPHMLEVQPPVETRGART